MRGYESVHSITYVHSYPHSAAGTIYTRYAAPGLPGDPFGELSQESRLPSLARTEAPLLTPGPPRAPVPLDIGVDLCRHLLLIGQVLLALVFLEVVVGALITDIEAVAHQRIGVDVIDGVIFCALNDLCGGRRCSISSRARVFAAFTTKPAAARASSLF
jgi:hypothetical protein